MKQELKDDNQKVFCQVEFLADKNITYATWIVDYATLEHTKKGGALMLEVINNNNTPFIINDNRQVTGPWDASNDWIADVWMPLIIEAGVKKFAHIMSKDFFEQLSSEFMEENSKIVEGDFQMRSFDNYEEAEEWLIG